MKDLPFCLRGSSSVYCFATSDTEFELRKKENSYFGESVSILGTSEKHL